MLNAVLQACMLALSALYIYARFTVYYAMVLLRMRSFSVALTGLYIYTENAQVIAYIRKSLRN